MMWFKTHQPANPKSSIFESSLECAHGWIYWNILRSFNCEVQKCRLEFRGWKYTPNIAIPVANQVVTARNSSIGGFSRMCISWALSPRSSLYLLGEPLNDVFASAHRYQGAAGDLAQCLLKLPIICSHAIDAVFFDLHKRIYVRLFVQMIFLLLYASCCDFYFF